MCGLEAHGCDNAGVEGLFPGPDADAPPIPGLQPGEAEFGTRRNEVVADRFLVLQKLIVHEHANSVTASVLRAAVTFPVSIETGEGVSAASLKHPSQNILNHTEPAYLARGGSGQWKKTLRNREWPCQADRELLEGCDRPGAVELLFSAGECFCRGRRFGATRALFPAAH